MLPNVGVFQWEPMLESSTVAAKREAKLTWEVGRMLGFEFEGDKEELIDCLVEVEIRE